ncbi:lipopolysaccharide-binding protein-like, partial [Mizuhopecten yessoensis]|uniref:lipopolysaccharide-binding protein-like n=1 Tax=Mizuhopecten yessoensis TaxID=6573 RepID=UPI000B458615
LNICIHSLKFSDDGSFDISVSGVYFSVQADFGVDITERPSISAGPCTSDIGGVSIKFHGKWAWAYNAFQGQFEEKIKSLLKDKMCDLISRSLNTDAEKSLSLLKITVGIGNMFELSYKLTGPPTFTSDYMETYHKVRDTVINNLFICAADDGFYLKQFYL